MKRPTIAALTIPLIITSAGISSAVAQDPLGALEAAAIIEQKVMVPMRDGIRLATDIYRPKTDDPVPTIFVRM